jgi:ribonuclease-3 family protein
VSNQDNDFQGEYNPQSFREDEGSFCWPINNNQIANLSSLKQVSPIALAYLGDAVYELYIRTRYLFPLKRISDYHQQVVTEVRAETQACYLEYLQPYLTESEQEIVRRGRNAVTKIPPRRLSPKVYRQATSLEALLGYLYLQNPQRLEYLLSKLVNNKLPID